MMRVSAGRLAFAFATAIALHAVAVAAPSEAERKAEAQAAWAAADKVATVGPADLAMAGQAKLKLPAGEAFIPADAANRVMKAMGNESSPSRFGLIVPTDAKTPWLIDVAWIKEGYVRDGEAKEWKADALLANLREGTEAANPDRQARGFAPLEVVGWAEPPAYDAGTHRLVWSLLLKQKGAPAGEPQTVNYNTYALGREGYFELDLITGSQTIATDKNAVRSLLGQLNYLPGKRYQDFNESTDKVAIYGIGALLGIVAAKKLGLLAVAGLFLLKVWKIGLLAVVGGIAAVRKFMAGRGTPPTEG